MVSITRLWQSGVISQSGELWICLVMAIKGFPTQKKSILRGNSLKDFLLKTCQSQDLEKQSQGNVWMKVFRNPSGRRICCPVPYVAMLLLFMVSIVGKLMVWRVALNRQSGVYIEATHHRVRLVFIIVKIPGAGWCHENIGEMTNMSLNLIIFEVFEIWDLGLSNSQRLYSPPIHRSY